MTVISSVKIDGYEYTFHYNYQNDSLEIEIENIDMRYEPYKERITLPREALNAWYEALVIILTNTVEKYHPELAKKLKEKKE